MHGQDVNREFDAFRRERNMRRAQRHSNELIESGGSDVVSQIEASERRQVADARLLREMHDFFEGATRTAAGILQQVSHEAEHETAARLRGRDARLPERRPASSGLVHARRGATQ